MPCPLSLNLRKDVKKKHLNDEPSQTLWFHPTLIHGICFKEKKKGRKKIERILEVVIASRENMPRNHHQLHQFRLPMEIHGRSHSLSGAEREKCCPFMLARGLKVIAEKRSSPMNAWR